jgi:hypothetical protein
LVCNPVSFCTLWSSDAKKPLSLLIVKPLVVEVRPRKHRWIFWANGLSATWVSGKHSWGRWHLVPKDRAKSRLQENMENMTICKSIIINLPCTSCTLEMWDLRVLQRKHCENRLNRFLYLSGIHSFSHTRSMGPWVRLLGPQVHTRS